MPIDLYGKRKARKAWTDAGKTHGVVQTALDSAWHWLNGVASGIAHFFTGTVSNAIKTIWLDLKQFADALKEVYAALYRISYWVQIHVIKYLLRIIMHKYDVMLAKLRAQVARLIRLIYVTTNSVLITALKAVKVEQVARIKAVRRAEAQARQEIRAVHQTIEREAASAYRLEYDQRVSAIVRLLDFAAAREPLIKDIVGTITKGLLDLVAVDDPIARLVLGFLINDVIDKLGVDKAVGHLARDLLAPILGQPKPAGLHGVIADLGARVVAAEAFEATFMADGGSEVEQAGKLWRDITQPAAAAGIVAFIGTAIAAPDAWARTITEVAGKPADHLITATAKLIKGA